MDFETAMEIVADRDGTVEWGLVKEAAQWLMANGYAEQFRELIYGKVAHLYEEIKAEPTRGKNERDI